MTTFAAGKPLSNSTGAQLDVVFYGPLLFVPEIRDGKITDLEVFSPRNGHPVGAVFMPEVWFSDAELNDPKSLRWPEPETFSLLDPHSYALDITQTQEASATDFPISAIPANNHRVKSRRRLSGEWDVAVSVIGKMADWASLRCFEVKDGVYQGSDSPQVGSQVSVMHRLTYQGVTGADFLGASPEAKEYLNANIAEGGTIIIQGEVPYQPSFQHERQAIDALSRLAGLDLHWVATAPTPNYQRLMYHLLVCGASIVVA
jgi:hypothetical protein